MLGYALALPAPAGVVLVKLEATIGQIVRLNTRIDSKASNYLINLNIRFVFAATFTSTNKH